MYLPIFKPLIFISMNVVQDLSNIDFVKAPLDSKLFQDNNTTAPATRRAFLLSLWGRTCYTTMCCAASIIRVPHKVFERSYVLYFIQMMLMFIK